ncbi:MAG: protein phosphatase 2C domain-containing protein, partial [Reinekea sp.]
GHVRNENEDRMSGAQTHHGRLFIIADGMGGYAGGARAASLTVDSIVTHCNSIPQGTAPEEILSKAIAHANTTVYRERLNNPQNQQMGSTALVALIVHGVLYLAHVGDSRAYLFRQGQLTPLTTDHTLPQRLINEGLLNQAEADKHPQRHVLDRAIGVALQVEVDVSPARPLESGDALLLCSDGLCGYINDKQITANLTHLHAKHQQLGSTHYAHEVAESLIKLSLEGGSEDNITVQYIRYVLPPSTVSQKKILGGMLTWLPKLRHFF